MYERLTTKIVMITEFLIFDEIIVTFEKYLNGATVRVFENHKEIDVFTNYYIGRNGEKFEAACARYIQENYEENLGL